MHVSQKSTPQFKKATDADVETVFAVSVAVFGGEDEKHGLAEWRRRLRAMHGRIFYVQANDGSVLGFVFVHAHATSAKTMHVWIAATHPCARRQGVMRRLFQHCRRIFGGDHARLTVNTFPARFPHMPPFLTALGYAPIGIQGEKHCYALQLDAAV
ncbi:hypothetical protein SPRG_10468 [Saprolegnia parasitica CBS 223.65]|uniref:N-acetyltransferase domain-containing protein n=1 Tax=Saprolegnia parasitica (strain CBS 223.65) TaxID=695850 RepID=A0A067CCX0_SAPPC|nr:hypothetical protein SPRG_10468 [Saprolegnia parasitica CBS 223.65]KDO24391.1 hypothetical protein SPRG_10468 [Saprolegnia parasitica CBS 223.65]|eukprot:XP_012204983.1 hypothetical protein SPRG_10468 [Saprolegnia parasitica CBS 223.65]